MARGWPRQAGFDSPDLLGWQADVPPLGGCKEGGSAASEHWPPYRPLDPPVVKTTDGLQLAWGEKAVPRGSLDLLFKIRGRFSSNLGVEAGPLPPKNTREKVGAWPPPFPVGFGKGVGRFSQHNRRVTGPGFEK